MKVDERILLLLKTRGAMTAQELAAALDMTAMGVRRHLDAAAQLGLVGHTDVAGKVGHPARHWSLAPAANARFPDRHADLALQLMGQATAVFGAGSLARLIAAREPEMEAHYAAALQDQPTLAGRVAALAAMRDAEGYMAASAAQPDGSVLLIENHCPICAAATACQDLCASELAVFQRVLGAGCSVARTEHLLAGARRCVYLVRQA